MAKLCSRIFPVLLLQALITLVVSAIVPDCKNCGCCVDNECGRGYSEVDRNYVNEYCTNGCIPGIYGNKCYSKCPDQCLTCERVKGKRCTSCIEGKYLSSSTCTNCTERCKSCSSATQCQECNPPYYNDRGKTDCSLICPGNCICEDLGICSSCQEGYYNMPNMCTSICPDKCKTCSDQNTCQTCKDGYYNGKENDDTNSDEVSDCSLSCKKNCTSCNSSNQCTHCTDGKYGTKCQNTCSFGCQNGVCGISNGSCECKDRFTGTTCSECIIGLYGEMCNRACPTNCKENKCVKNTGRCFGCNSVNITGDTCDQCVTGTWDSMCSSVCPSSCSDGGCVRENGFCNLCKGNFGGDRCDTCFDGYYGIECDKKCPINCIESYCKRDTGYCYSCKDMYAGLTCDLCRNGFFGPLCDNECSPACFNSSCDPSTGFCFGCVAGFTGDMCCLEDGHCRNCFSNTVCDTCSDGFYGQACDKECRENCKNLLGRLRCERKSGFCSICEDGFHGNFCNLLCSNQCLNNRCNKDNGHCSEGCLNGYTGPTCAEALNYDVRTLGISSAVTIVIVTMLIIALFIILRQWFRKVHDKIMMKLNQDPKIHASYVNTEFQPDETVHSDDNAALCDFQYEELNESNQGKTSEYEQI